MISSKISHKRIIICLWLASLLLAGTGLAQFDKAFSETEPREPMDSRGLMPHRTDFREGIPIEVLYSGRGFALLNNESHILRLNVESLMPLDPSQIRKLLASNKSLEEISQEIRAKGGEAIHRGGMRLDKIIYPLVNITISPSDDNLTNLSAEVGVPPGNETSMAGSITLSIAPADGTVVGKGELILTRGPQAGTYSVLLEMQPSMHGKGMMGPRR